MAVEPDASSSAPGTSAPQRVNGSTVASFYAGAGVLVTGGTGFLGKVLIEKLLWACPDVAAIYVLTRNKHGQAGQERIETMLRSQCFDRLRLSRGPEFGSKVIAVQGDVTKDRLGLDDLDLALLARHVSVVFHVAATIRFNEPLQEAVTQNVRGTRELLAICRTCPGIKAVVHVSTAFSHCPLPDIEERFYDAPMDCDLAIKMAAGGEFTLAVRASLLGSWPNTYTFTKALAEDVVRKHGHGLPVCVFRPAIVIPSLSEPVEGWVDNVAGPAGFLAGYLTGFIRVMPGNPKMTTALVPCDMVVDGMIAAAWDVAQRGPALESQGSMTHEPRVYNYTTSPSNVITWPDYLTLNRRHSRDVPSHRAIWTPSCVLSRSRAILLMLRLVLHALPAAIADTAFVLTGSKPHVSRLYNRIHRFGDECGYFSTRQWNFQQKNVPALWNKMGRRDRALFNFDMAALDWDQYAKTTSHGIRKFLLKEDPSTIPAARDRYQRILQAKLILQAVLCLAVTYAVVFVTIMFNASPTPTSWPVLTQ